MGKARVHGTAHPHPPGFTLLGCEALMKARTSRIQSSDLQQCSHKETPQSYPLPSTPALATALTLLRRADHTHKHVPDHVRPAPMCTLNHTCA